MAGKAPKPPTPNEVALADAQNLLQLWLKIKSFYAKAASEDPISREDETEFLETKSDVSKLQRTLGSKLPAGIGFAADKLQELLRQSISLGHLRSLPKNDRQGLLAVWHQVFVYLSQAVGALQFICEGYTPPERAQKKGGVDINQLKKGAGGDKKKKSNPLANPKLWVAIILIAVAAFFVLSRR